MTKPTDFILIKASVSADAVPALAQATQEFFAQSAITLTLHRAAWSADTQTLYLYARLIDRTELSDDALPPLHTAFAKACPQANNIRVARLQSVFTKPGLSRAEPAVFHYVVETDPENGWANEIYRWYDTEHMPGLAAVSGCILAMRLLNHDHGSGSPVSFACYDLVTTDTLGSPDWLAVRHTAWSDIARPHFTNTLRTMFDVVA
jgi:hypothetical protein